jgi:hypothetical protein
MHRLAVVLVVAAACGGGPSITTDGPIIVPPGSGVFHFSWNIVVGGSPATCAEVGAARVEIIMTGPSSQESVERFTCTSPGMATTSPLPEGQYSTLISLLDSQNLSRQTLPIETNFLNDGGSTELGLFFFSFGSTCDASTCNQGCCDDVSGCVTVQSDFQCGTGGVPCDNCADVGLTCDTINGFCTGV